MCRLFFRCGCLIVFLVLVAGCGLLYFVAKPALDTPNTFLAAIRDGNYTAAYNSLGSDLQNQLGNAGNLAGRFDGLAVSSWNLTGFSAQGSQMQANGNVTFTNGQTGTISVVIGFVDNTWKIVGFDIKPTGNQEQTR